MKVAPYKLAKVCQAIYGEVVVPDVSFVQLWEYGGTVAGRCCVDGADVIVFRGSLTRTDWLQDAKAIPLWDDRLGHVHAGFMSGVDDVRIAVSLIGGLQFSNVVVTGHSLGGARARLFAGLCAHAGTPVAQLCTFGAPRPGFSNLRRILEKSGTPMQSFRNRNDPVPLVPTILPWWDHTDNWTEVDSAPPPEELHPLRDHGIHRYLEGLTKLEQAVAAIAEPA